MNDPTRILVVEDDPTSLALVRFLLEARGHAVFEAADAATALDIARNHRIDLALIDLVLPDRAGVDLARDLRALPGGDIALIAVSAHFGPLDDARLSPIGFSDCLAKPIDAEALHQAIDALVVSPHDEAPSVGQQRRVLLVDDDPVQLRLHASRFERLDFVVETAADGLAALAACDVSPPDVIVSDVLMPRLDGFGLCHAIRNHPVLASIPVILVSSNYLDPEDEALGHKVGATRYIARAPGTNDVLDALVGLVEAPPAPREPEPEISSAELASDHAARVGKQLERQTQLNRVLRERSVFQQALLSVSAAIAESLGAAHEPAEILAAALAPILEARGFRVSLAFMSEPDGELNLVSTVGRDSPGAETLWGRLSAVERAIASREVVVMPATGPTRRDDQEWLATFDAGSVIIVPIDQLGRGPFGAVALISDMTSVSSEVFAFARALRHTLARALAHAYTEERLLHAQKMDAIGRLAAGIAHDFNNLLAGISCFASFTRDSFEPDSQEYLDLGEILRAVGRGAALTGQLLAFGRKQNRSPKVLRPDHVVAGLLPMLERLLGDEISIAPKLDVPECRIVADSSQLEQVLMNLAINARDAMPNGGEIEVRTRTTELVASSPLLGPRQSAGVYYVIEVADRGQGMSKETMARAFEPFFTSKDIGKGTGLGLATVYGIIEQTGGHVSIQSVLGAGTVVTIALPVTDQVEEDAANYVAATQFSGSATVLFVEDDAALRTIVTRTMSAAGLRVLTARDGHEALALSDAETRPLALLITDVSMPTMKGTELAARLIAQRPDLSVLYVSGYSDVALGSDVLRSRDRFLGKPFTTDQLLLLVGQMLGDAPAA